MRTFRLCRNSYRAYDGEGARRVGGRWNSKRSPGPGRLLEVAESEFRPTQSARFWIMHTGTLSAAWQYPHHATQASGYF